MPSFGEILCELREDRRLTANAACKRAPYGAYDDLVI